MNLFLGFSPYVAFFVVTRLATVEAGLVAALAVALVLAGRGWWKNGEPKLLEVGAAVLFAGLALYTWVAARDWSLTSVRLVVDAGLLAIVLLSLAMGQPFTLQYARERVPAAQWHAPHFLAINRAITWAWAAAFALLVAAHAIVVLVPSVSVLLDGVATVIAFAGAGWFTTWYPAHVLKTAGARRV